jgi:NAD(P)H-dependent FMN reductase
MQNTPIKIKVIIGSTRQGRFGDKPGHWIFEELKKMEGVDAELLDLRDFPLPFFDEPVSPSYSKEPYSNEQVKKWAEKIADGDGFLVVTPEYNHGYPAVLKNALDYLFKEWNGKAVGFVGYGNAGGAKSIEQLRQVAIELQMHPIRNSIHIPWEIYMAVMNEKVPANPELFSSLRKGNDRVEHFLTQLVAMARTLKTASA